MGTRVYIGNLGHSVRERDVERFFKGYGKIREIMMKNGYGFVEFEDSRDADDAVYDLNGKDLLGDRVLVERARGVSRRFEGGGSYGRQSYGAPSRSRTNDKYGPPTRTKFRLIVENLSSRVSWQDLKDYMRQAGEVTYADAHLHKKNEGVVEFATYSDMKRALDKLDDTDINGRRIRLVDDYNRKKSGSRSRSRSRSRHKSRSRSRSRSKKRSSKKRSKSREKNKSRSRSKSRSREKKSSPTPKKDRSRSKSRSPSENKTERKERSKSPAEQRESPKNENEEKNEREQDEDDDDKIDDDNKSDKDD